MNMYDWVDFEDGRARFSGGIRGWDELRHETFCVELNGESRYGEAITVFEQEGDNFGLEIISFGYRLAGDAGMPASSRDPVSVVDIEKIKVMVAQLIDIVAQCDHPPFVLSRGITSRFTGKVAFQDGWINTTAH
ncbi:hypothetical protein [Dyella mobilis]|uniref:Uncharacterized protein n=1 Tax=Dyella mobilis TaxID=1849582 RepID=A0ABS2KCL5_9GAMM|nr:hypothetical protein [Dyella mobilis]MBM7128926.1 hypothetical protein [Dyella mobilis]GLQ99384.1 hypothetical protein GCM10007863_38040 [Dyella mobilis]